MSLDFALSPELEALAAEARQVGREIADRYEIREDSWIAGHDAAVAKDLAARGWIGMTWPTEHGGGGRSVMERFVVFEELISAGAPIAAAWFADRQIGPTLLEFGTPEQQAEFLPGILSGEAMWGIGMSEPDAGSDVASIRTRAVPYGDPAGGRGGGWVVDGQKIWTSGAAHSDFIYLVARTDPDARPHEGLSELVVDLRSPGVGIVPIVDMTGDDHFCEVYFDGVRVPAANLVGTANGSFKQIMRQMEHERGGSDRLVSNRRLYEDVLAVADTTDPLLRQEVAALEIDYRLGRLLVIREVLGQAPKGFSAATKTFCTEHEQRVADFCGRVLGPGALLADEGLRARVARNITYAPGYTIMGGTTNILRNILGERVLGLPRGPRS
ncbi:acyl-CoA dehydrogenase family protein [soil metagenome]